MGSWNLENCMQFPFLRLTESCRSGLKIKFLWETKRSTRVWPCWQVESSENSYLREKSWRFRGNFADFFRNLSRATSHTLVSWYFMQFPFLKVTCSDSFAVINKQRYFSQNCRSDRGETGFPNRKNRKPHQIPNPKAHKYFLRKPKTKC